MPLPSATSGALRAVSIGFEAIAWSRPTPWPDFGAGSARDDAFDAEYFEQLAVPSGNTGLIAGQPGEPRTYGLTLTISF
jgi:hypothetical protein